MRIGFPLICLLMVIEIFLTAACDGSREIHKSRITSEMERAGKEFEARSREDSGAPVPLSFVSVSGHVRTADGKPLPNARLHLSGGRLERSIFKFTDASGRFHFEPIAIGANYRLAVRGNPQVFKISSRTIDVSGEVNDIEFVAEPSALRESSRPR